MKVFVCSLASRLVPLAAIGMVVAATACADLKPEAAVAHNYYDAAGVINRVAAAHNAAKVQVRKRTETRQPFGEAETVDWQREMAPFLAADINKPVLKDVYRTERTDSTWTYIALRPEEKVQRLCITYPDKPVPTRIEAEMQEANLLYQTQRRLAIDFDGDRIARYYISGYQKILFADTLHYRLSAQTVE